MESKEKFARAYSKFNSLKSNVTDFFVHEKFVHEFHGILDSLTDAGIEMDEFKISDSELKRVIHSSNYETGEVNYGDYREIDKSFFMYKLDSVINFLTDDK
jgi:hypothetical protein